jgi:glucan phosphoethanolaminetransferase (alkaline phosphatase superfamily)
MNWLIFYLIGVVMSFVMIINSMHTKSSLAYLGAFFISLVSWIGIAACIGQIHYKVWEGDFNNR